MLIGKEANEGAWGSLELETVKAGGGAGIRGSAEGCCETQSERGGS